MPGVVTSTHELSYLKEDGWTVTTSSALSPTYQQPLLGLQHLGTDVRSVVLTSEQPMGPAQLTRRTIQKG